MAFAELVHLYNNMAEDDFYRQLSSQVLSNIHMVPQCSSYRLAELCFVSQSSIRALAKKLGYPSYSDFKASMKWDLSRYNSLYKYHTVPQASGVKAVLDGIRKTFDWVEQSVTDEAVGLAAADILSKQKTCFVTMQGSPQQRLLQQSLILLGKQAAMYTVTQGEFEGILAADEDTAVIFIIMNLIERFDIMEYSKQAKAKGTKTILITNTEPMSRQPFFDHTLYFTGSTSLTDMYGLDTIQEMLNIKIQELAQK